MGASRLYQHCTPGKLVTSGAFIRRRRCLASIWDSLDLAETIGIAHYLKLNFCGHSFAVDDGAEPIMAGLPDGMCGVLPGDTSSGEFNAFPWPFGRQ